SQSECNGHLMPQLFFILLGMGGASLYLVRLAKGPHVTWNKKNNPEPWNQLDPTYQYKAYIQRVNVHISYTLICFGWNGWKTTK
uniref:Uncharacterized protein n=1 Tax=Oncorhynchus kisutch TaxID=8019 RepID=A0A8C7NBW8_ONCKI